MRQPAAGPWLRIITVFNHSPDPKDIMDTPDPVILFEDMLYEPGSAEKAF